MLKGVVVVVAAEGLEEVKLIGLVFVLFNFSTTFFYFSEKPDANLKSNVTGKKFLNLFSTTFQ